ncbi:hypothetical protein [Cystobacter fuscus]|uniref:hypothetical protein n=1 Tax=Cystobacter fuscus TaxID=43 RepID=UPI0037C198CC
MVIDEDRRVQQGIGPQRGDDLPGGVELLDAQQVLERAAQGHHLQGQLLEGLVLHLLLALPQGALKGRDTEATGVGEQQEGDEHSERQEPVPWLESRRIHEGSAERIPIRRESAREIRASGPGRSAPQ